MTLRSAVLCCRLAVSLLAVPLLAPPAALAQEGAVNGPMTMPSSAAKAAKTSGRNPAGLNNDAIIRMSKAGLDPALIVQTIRTQPGAYATGPDDLIGLKDAGVTPAVISAMMARSSGLAEHGAAADSIDVTPLAPGIDEEGVYRKDRDGRWVALAPELVRYKSGGWAKSTLTNNIVKKDRNGEVSGAQAPIVLKPGDELEILAPPNTDAIEYQLLRFRLHANSREFRASTGGVFNSHDGVERDQVTIKPSRVSPRIFAFTIPADVGGGEFGVLPPGAASTPGIAFAGKIYTFAITVDK